MKIHLENQSVKIFGNGLYQAQVNIQNSFVIDAQSVFNPSDKIKIITYPSRYSCHIQANTNHKGIWTINYTPHKIGQLQIDIFLGDKLLNSNPFKINVFDINQINISNLNDGFVDKLVRFDIDINRAGTGQLDILVENGRIPCQIISTNLSIFNAFFLPHKSGEYMIDVRFNGLTIPGSPFFCQIKNLPRVIVYNNLLNAHVGHPLSFDIYNQSQLLDIKIIGKSI
jgi:filamin